MNNLRKICRKKYLQYDILHILLERALCRVISAIHEFTYMHVKFFKGKKKSIKVGTSYTANN